MCVSALNKLGSHLRIPNYSKIKKIHTLFNTDISHSLVRDYIVQLKPVECNNMVKSAVVWGMRVQGLCGPFAVFRVYDWGCSSLGLRIKPSNWTVIKSSLTLSKHKQDKHLFLDQTTDSASTKTKILHQLPDIDTSVCKAARDQMEWLLYRPTGDTMTITSL